MHAVRVHVYIDAPVEKVFDAVSDHESFLRTEEDMTTMVVRAGARDRNGLGCLRAVQVGTRARYVEEITAWERPIAFEYTIRESSLPLRHEGSRLTFTPRGQGTDVEWTSRFEVAVPVVGRLLGVLAKRRYVAAFTELLRRSKARLEAG